MRRAIKLTALGLMGAIALTVASYLTLVAVAFFESGAGPHQSYARFESARPAEVIVPQSDPAAATEQLSELVRRAATEGRKVSIAGSQHSMGGHTLSTQAGWSTCAAMPFGKSTRWK